MLQNNIEIVKVKGINKCTFKNKNVWEKLQQKMRKERKILQEVCICGVFLSIQDITASM